MDETKALQFLVNEIDKLRNDNAAFVAAGRAINFDEYRHVCGVIRGLTYAETIVKDLAKKMEFSDD